MISDVKTPSDLVQIVTLLAPVLTLAVTAFIAWKQGQMKEDQAKLADRVDGHMTAMLAQKDEITKVTAEAARALGNREGAQEKKAEIRADAQEAMAGVAATDKQKVAPVAEA